MYLASEVEYSDLGTQVLAASQLDLADALIERITFLARSGIDLGNWSFLRSVPSLPPTAAPAMPYLVDADKEDDKGYILPPLPSDLSNLSLEFQEVESMGPSMMNPAGLTTRAPASKRQMGFLGAQLIQEESTIVERGIVFEEEEITREDIKLFEEKLWLATIRKEARDCGCWNFSCL
ncbi:hypothetical protein BGZ60DRAFT_428111 [Tricladium varicosporioides]|nr:hypothetical protein BGZ60DRAFT_428111 [Hymenoscyphus varicosporioides]